MYTLGYIVQNYQVSTALNVQETTRSLSNMKSVRQGMAMWRTVHARNVKNKCTLNEQTKSSIFEKFGPCNVIHCLVKEMDGRISPVYLRSTFLNRRKRKVVYTKR